MGPRGPQGPRGPAGERGEPGIPAPVEIIKVISTELEDVQRALQVQFKRIAQLQDILDDLRRKITAG